MRFWDRTCRSPLWRYGDGLSLTGFFFPLLQSVLGMGIDAAGVANYAPNKVGAAFLNTAQKVSRMRSQRGQGKVVSNEFTAEERKEME